MRIKIDKLGINGEGIGYIAENTNKVCFVDGTLPDEFVEITITNDKKNYCIAKCDKIIKHSNDRVNPQCKYFGLCGGCDVQHMDKQLQLNMKCNNIKDTIRKISGIEIDVEKIIRLNDFGYRNKMVFPYFRNDNSSILGMFIKNSHKVIDIDNCLLASDDINKFFKITKEYLINSQFTGYDYKNNSGDIKYFVIRESNHNILVTVVATRELNLHDYYLELKKNFNNIGLSLLISDSDDEIMSGRYIHLFGNEYLQLSEFGIIYKVDNRGFLQVNNKVKYYLYEYILNQINSNSVVIDAYSGAGLLSAIISRKCNSVIGIEINKSASNSAKNLAIDNNLSNIEFVCGDVKDIINTVLDNVENSIVILDPPRSGCDEKVLNLLNYANCKKNDKNSEKNEFCRVSKIIYISCNVATLSRDLKILSEKFNIDSVVAMEMFPQTKHVETIVCLSSKN